MQGVLAIHGCLLASGVMSGLLFGLDEASGKPNKRQIITKSVIEYSLICTFPYISLPYLMYTNPNTVKRIFHIQTTEKDSHD
jgi:hypothetical protein